MADPEAFLTDFTEAGIVNMCFKKGNQAAYVEH